MAEITGLVVGVVALLPLAISGWETCTEVFNNVRKYNRDVRKTGDKLTIQRHLFERECELLLRCVVREPATVRAMMLDRAHPCWGSPRFKTRWSRILGDVFDAPIEIIKGTLEHMHTELKKMEGTAQGKMDEHGRMVYSNAKQRKTAKAMARKVDWILSGKARLQDLIDTLRDQNQDLRNLREQRALLEPPAYLVRDAAEAAAAAGGGGDARIAAVLRLRDDAKKLLRGLSSTAVCDCHQVNLRLSSFVEETDRDALARGGEPTVKFHFMVTKHGADRGGGGGGGGGKQRVVCLTVCSEFQQEEKPPPVPRGKSHTWTDAQAPATRIKPRSSFKVPSKVRFAESPPSPPPPHPLPSPSSSPKSPARPSPPIIDRLCALLETLPSAQPGARPHQSLGVIRNDAYANPRYVIYPGPPAFPSVCRISLEELLARADGHRFLPQEERLKIALTLALSLLHFGSYSASWFQERWRSRDVFFFVDLSGNVVDSRDRVPSSPDHQQDAMEPYVVPFSATTTPSSSSSSPSSTHAPGDDAPSQGLARNEQLYSLSLVMIEIALGERISRFYTPSLSSDSVDEFSEFIRAKGLVESRKVGSQMGKDFADVVKRCFYCDFGLGEADFSKRELQEMFYRRVVCKLEECLRKFRGD